MNYTLYMNSARYGRLQFIADAPDAPGVKGSDRKRWLMRCDCGAEVVKSVRTVKRGQTVSCGCYNIEQKYKMHLTHGQSFTPEYGAWKSMKNRCNSTTHKQAKDYSLRGITYCRRWESFENFLADMGKKPSSNHSLDRINNDLGYSPENCRWATKREQQINRRATLLFSFRGELLTSGQIADRFQLPRRTVHRRLTDGQPADFVVVDVARKVAAKMSRSS